MATQYHLGIFHEKYVDLIFSGNKTIESRLSSKRIAPYHKVKSNDVVFIKPSSKPIVGYFIVKSVKYFELSSKNELLQIKQQYNARILGSDDFWEQKQHAKYATLMWTEKSSRLKKPLVFPKKDRRSWMVLKKLPDSDEWKEVIQELTKMTRSRQSNSLKKRPAR